MAGVAAIDFCLDFSHSVHTRHWINVGLMLGHRLRRWPGINPAVVQFDVTSAQWVWLRVPPLNDSQVSDPHFEAFSPAIMSSFLKKTVTMQNIPYSYHEVVIMYDSTNVRFWINVDLMLAHRWKSCVCWFVFVLGSWNMRFYKKYIICTVSLV